VQCIQLRRATMKLKRRVSVLEQQLKQESDNSSTLRDINTALQMDKKQLETSLVEYKQRVKVRCSEILYCYTTGRNALLSLVQSMSRAIR